MTPLRLLDRTVEAAAVLSFVVSSLFVFINVLNRYLVLGAMRNIAKEYESFRPAYGVVRDLFGSISVTADEVPGLLLVWIAFLGAYLAMRREGHIAFDMIAEALPAAGKRILGSINAALIAAFLLMLLWQSIRMIQVSGATEIETAEIAQGWFMLIIPFAAILLLTAVIARWAKAYQRTDGTS